MGRVLKRVLAALALVFALGAFAAAYLYSSDLQLFLGRGRGVIGIIEIRGYVITPGFAEYYAKAIKEAMENDTIKAVVIVIDSFGGYANYVERIYLDLKELSNRKPVVALAVNALSGGYYIAVAADYIFAHPTSMIGSIGAISTAPPLLIPSERVLETGAYKHTGFSRLMFFFNLSHVLDSFIQAIEEGRGERLKASREELSKALVYLGVEAVKLGLVDEIGSLEKAVSEAARRAGLVEYEVVEVRPKVRVPTPFYTWSNLTVSVLEKLHPPPAVYYVYLGARAVEGEKPVNVSGTAEVWGKVIIDASHGNLVSWWSLDALLAELAKLNVSVGFAKSWGELEDRLSNASCLIIAAPTLPYREEEVEAIAEFVERGGVLVLLFDPSFEYIGFEGLRSGVTVPINTVASRFGVTFGFGYLYDEERNFGIYRNIYVDDFANVSLFKGVNSMVLFTAAPVRSNYGVAWTANSTYSSAAEAPGRYQVVALVKRGNGTVVAMGDITLFSEPFCRVADNARFVENLARFIANATPAPAVSKEAEERVEKPNLPVGTVKEFVERVNGEERRVKWTRVREDLVVVERPDMVVRYYYVDEKLARWEADNITCVYDEPLPQPPYPLTKGKAWEYSTGFTLEVRGEKHRGELAGKERVVGFEEVEALDGKRYFCAKVWVEITEKVYAQGSETTAVTRGYYWVSAEAGLVKQETTTTYYYRGVPTTIVTRSVILASIKKPGV